MVRRQIFPTIIGVTLALVWLGAGLVGPVAAQTPDKTGDDPLVILGDALSPPDAPLTSMGAEATTGEPGYYQTSEYLIGNVAVGLILPESDGSQEAESEDWTEHEIAQVQEQVQAALDWWATLEPAAHLSFTVEVHAQVPIGYEPINHTLGEERLWIGETMAALGFENSPYFSAVRDYVNDLRDRAGADWAFVIFVVDSSADDDGRFADGYFAYAYVGGPFMVMTYDNSGYGIGNMAAVAAHETGHIFRALDQYAASGIQCDFQSGYLGVKNGNSLAGGPCESDEPSIMRGGLYPYQIRAVDHFARGQIGWWDSDGDGVLDPVDAAPQLTARREAVTGENDDVFVFSGQVRQEPVPSPTLDDVFAGHIAAVSATVDGVYEAQATALDGVFDTLSETYRLQIGPLTPGLHTIELRAVNTIGVASASIVTTTFVYDPVDGALNTALLLGPAAAAQGERVHFEGVATSAYGETGPDVPTVATVQFRVDAGEWQEATPTDGQFDSTVERFSIVLTDQPDGSHTLTVRAVDSQGRVETNVSEHPFETHTTYTLFIPLVQR